ncbi:hypothetical protein SAY87_023277 [Trapa incisa]|uniref:Protein POLAR LOCALIZATION DURING ASYMMETRIC DIVISION AND REDISTRIBUTION n=1 Tax=Trapa incisa TaxID=236973 RepID=A0AAN7K8Y7_9MYRT|nr:hypothetical protein SAY87_023277 [Trapa incisa]
MQQLLKSLHGHSTEPCPPLLRIADILLFSDDNDGERGEELVGAMNGFRKHKQGEVTCGLDCSSPRRIASRLLRKLKERRRPVAWREGNEKVSVDGQSNQASDEKCGGGGGGSLVGIAKSEDSGSCGNENMLNMGVACSLLYLMASSRDELRKMKDLRTDVEMLLDNVKEFVQRKDSVSDKLVLKESPAASCLTGLKKVTSCSSGLLSSQSTATPYLLQGEEIVTLSGQSVVRDGSRKEYVEEMGPLEAELEAELERLQVQLDTESFPQSMKVTGDGITAERSDDFSPGEVINLNESTMNVLHAGVPPIELERKLHELLESRQRERINELEAALEYMKQKLSEKEREAKWWKDTALLMSRNDPDPSDCK